MKVADRIRVMQRMEGQPVVCEAFAGFGKIWERCYQHVKNGIAIESDECKAAYVAHQRPTWRVYEADAISSLSKGIGKDLPVNLLDLDPYGSPWDTLDAFLFSREIKSDLWIVVNDGLRQKLRVGGAWQVRCLADVVSQRGSDIHDVYLDVCEELCESKARAAKCRLERFAGYYCGSGKQMTHWTAKLVPIQVGG